MTKIIIFGKNGQVASNLLEAFTGDSNFKIYNYSSIEIDFNEIAELPAKLKDLPDADFIINATAYNHVDQAEDEPIKADNINHQSVRIVANFCKEKSIKLIHYSTNYVFDGKGEDAYFEDNIKNLKPLSIYGKSKLAGENAIKESGCNYLIFRVATVFDLNRTNNFPAKIKALAKTRDELKIVNDQFTNPTNSYDIARSTKTIIEHIIASGKFKNGIYHMVSNKPASYYNIACEVLKSQKVKIVPVDSSCFPTKAKRPKNGVLNCDKIKADFGIEFQNYYKQVTIIIVTYKSAHIISKTLDNIINKGYPIIIVDNNSQDNIENLINTKYNNSQIELIKLEKNIGFSKANNIALNKISTKFAFLLNPDAIIDEKSIEQLVIHSESDANIALAGSFDTKKQNPTSEEITQAIIQHSQTIKIIKNTENYIETNFICGGYMLMKLSIFEKIGFLDENLFLYGEDEEICDRVIFNNYRIIQVKHSSVYHNEHSATKTNGVFDKYLLLFKRYYHMGWSRVYLKRKRNRKIAKIFSSLILQFLSSFCYLIILRFDKFVIRLGRSIGGLKNLLNYKPLQTTKKNN